MFIKGFKRTHGKFYTFNQTEYSSYGCHDRHGNLIESRVGLGNFIHLRIISYSFKWFTNKLFEGVDVSCKSFNKHFLSPLYV